MSGYGSVNLPVLNEGRVEAIGGSLTFARELVNRGTLQAATASTLVLNEGWTQEGWLLAGGGGLDVNGPLRLEDPGELGAQQSVPIRLSGNLTGGATGSSESRRAALVFDGVGQVQVFEVVGQDLGLTREGFDANFSLASMALVQGAQVRLVDVSDNASGVRAEGGLCALACGANRGHFGS